MEEHLFDFRDLARAWSDMRRWAHAHDDLAGYHARRYRALSAAFGVDLDVPPAVAPPMPDWVIAWQSRNEWTTRPAEAHWWEAWPRQLLQLAAHAETSARSLASPFDDYLEAPLVLMAAAELYGNAVATPVREARARIFDMVVDLLAAVFPDAAARTVTPEALRAHGFDPGAPEPDPLDYW